MKRPALIVTLLGLATCCFTSEIVARLTAAPQAQAAGQPTAPKVDPQWIPVAAGEWKARAGSLVGKSVELSGKIETMILVDPKSAFSNIGWMRDADGVEIAHVLFDQAGPGEIQWMAKNRCHEGCVGVFVRGVVVTVPHEREPVLRMKEISFESRAGAAPTELVSIAGGADSAAPGAEKPLLPPGGLPGTEGGANGSFAIPTPSPVESGDKSTWGQMTARSEEMRQRDYNMDRGIVPGPERSDSFETAYRSIRDTRLNNVFAAFPWNTGRDPWPRVVLIVEEKPQLGSLLYKRPGDVIEDRCWRVSAKLWTGPAASETISPFNWCLSEMRFNEPYGDVALWGKTPKTSMLNQNTGAARTLGPNPPYVPAPDRQYRDGANFDTIMLGNLLLDMGFSLGVPDGRVWIVDKDSARPAH